MTQSVALPQNTRPSIQYPDKKKPTYWEVVIWFLIPGRIKEIVPVEPEFSQDDGFKKPRLVPTFCHSPCLTT